MTMNVEIHVAGRPYDVACAESDAPRIRELGRELAARAEKLQNQLGGLVGNSHLLVLTGLMMLDELADLKVRAATPVTVEKIIEIEKIVEKDNAEEQAILVSAVEHLTGRVNKIAQQLRAA